MKGYLLRFKEIWDTTKYGWDQVSWFFLLIGGAALFGTLLGLTGIIGTFASFIILYLIGLGHRRLNAS